MSVLGTLDQRREPTSEVFGLIVISAGFLWITLTTGQLLLPLTSLLLMWSVSGLGERLLMLGGLGSRIEMDRWAWRLGPGLVFGLTLLFFFRAVVSKDIFLGTTIIYVAVDLGIQSVHRVRHVVANIPFPTSLRQIALATSNVGYSFALIGLYVSREWQWALLIAIVAAVCSFLISRSGNAVSRFFVTIALLGAAMSVIYRVAGMVRPEFWYLAGDDNLYLQALSWSLIEAGPLASPIATGLNGFSSAAYHHNAYLFVGLIEVIGRGSPFDVLTKVSPVLLSISLVASLFVFLQSLIDGRASITNSSFFVVGACFVIVVPIGHYPASNQLGVVALVSTCATVLTLIRIGNPWRGQLVLALLLLATFFSKAHFAFGSLLLVLVSSTLLRQRKILSVVSMVTFFFLTLAVLGSANPYGGSLSLRWTSTQLEGSWPSLVASEGMRVFVILAPSIPSLVLAAWLWRTAAHHGERRLIVALSIVVLSSCGFRFAVAGLGSDYLYMPGWITSGLLVAITVRRFIESDTRKDTLKPLVTLVVVFGSMSVLVRSLPNTSFVLLSTTVAIAIIHLARRQTEQRTGVKETWSRRQSVPVLSIAVLTVAIVTMSVIDNQPSYFKAFVEARTGETNANRLTWSPSRELLDVADFLQRNTRQDSRIALTLCDAAQTACQYDQPYNFSVFSHRYFLSLGGTIIAGWPTQDLVYLDYRNSIVTDENKLGAVVEYWKSRGADYGVIDKERLTSSTELPQLIPALTRVFESERYVVVRLST